MPALGNYLGAICARVYALLAAEPQWTAKVKPAARLSRFDPEKLWPTLAPVHRSPVIVWDFRLLRGVPMPGAPRQGQTLTFATAGGANGPLVLSKQYTIQHVLTHPGMVQLDAALLETVLELVLVRAGPKLALSGSPLAYCAGCLPVTSLYAENNTAGPNGSPACVQTLTHPVGVVASAADILGT
jgi:hypothetical protein